MENRTLFANDNNSKQGLEVWKEFQEETKRPMELTTELLMKLIDDNKDTEYGKKYDFASIKTIEDYQKKVPVVVYDNLAPYLERMMDGERNLLTAY
ncbi:MAG: GH3 auxin-responsive promoter family protein, partial [Lachnospiraceae bacterium]|nr:GH3 auxin-responsive promoter family protein [Lachnospiraceae bacterium]